MATYPGPDKNCTVRSNIRIGQEVDIILKKDQPTGVRTHGKVSRILTNSLNHPRGIKVMLDGGLVGRVQHISSKPAEPQLCGKCSKRVAMQAFSQGHCKVCGRIIMCATTPADLLCAECAAREIRCVHCGEHLRG